MTSKTTRPDIRYKFSCGCIKAETVRIRTKAGGYMQACPRHHEPLTAKLIPCIDCLEIQERKLNGCVTSVRCPACAKIVIQKRNKSAYRKFSLNGYSTGDEISFIESLSQSSLKKYFEAIQNRQDWTGLNRSEILLTAATRLAL